MGLAVDFCFVLLNLLQRIHINMAGDAAVLNSNLANDEILSVSAVRTEVC